MRLLQEPRAQMYDDFMARVKHGCHTADHNLRGRLIDITSLPQASKKEWCLVMPRR